MRFNHINLVVQNPAVSADFYALLLSDAVIQEWLGDSLHVRDEQGVDFAFQVGTPLQAEGAHHGFLADSAEAVDHLLLELRARGVQITDDCAEEGFRSIKFLDPDGYEIEVYWESDWP